MTLSTTINNISYTANGSTAAFAVPFKFFADTHLAVTVDVGAGPVAKLLTTDYTVSGAGSEAGGTVTFLVNPAAAAIVKITRVTPITQLIDYIANDHFPAQVHENAIDKLTMICQQIADSASVLAAAQAAQAAAEVAAAAAEASADAAIAAGAAMIDTTDGDFTMPAVGATVVVTLVNGTWQKVDVDVMIQGAGIMAVTAINVGAKTMTVRNTGALNNQTPAATVPSGSFVHPVKDWRGVSMTALSVLLRKSNSAGIPELLTASGAYKGLRTNSAGTAIEWAVNNITFGLTDVGSLALDTTNQNTTGFPLIAFFTWKGVTNGVFYGVQAEWSADGISWSPWTQNQLRSTTGAFESNWLMVPVPSGFYWRFTSNSGAPVGVYHKKLTITIT